MKRLVFNKWYGWISNDPSIWGVGSFYNMEWVDTTTDLKYVQLSKSWDNETYLNNRWNGYIIASLYETNVNYLELSYDWYLSGHLNSDSNNWYVIKGDLWMWGNIGKITNWNWNTYWFLLTSDYFTKWSYNPNQNDLWYYASASTWINPDPSFDTTSWWTIWTWWNISLWRATHTPWNTAVLSRTMTCDNAKKYRIAIQYSCSAWTCDVKVAWSTKITLNTTNSNITQVAIYTSASTNELLEFVPSSNFNWYLNTCYIQEVYATSTSKAFSEKAPYNIYSNYIYVWNWNKVTRIDMATGTPVIEDVLNIDASFTIIWITRISDQFFIYATDWSNGRQYSWDWESNATDRIITWVDKPILNVANFANIDYVITWTSARQWIYIVNGYQLQPIIVTDDYVNSWDRIYFTSRTINNIETIWNKLLIAWEWWIYSFGNRTPWTQNALIKSYLHNGWWLTNIFYKEDIWHSIFAYYRWTINNWNQQWIYWNYSTQIYLPAWNSNERYLKLYNRWTWWIETQSITWDTYSNIKNSSKITIWYKLMQYTQINVYQKETETEKYANLYLDWNSLWFSVWDTYTFSWRTFTILNIIKPWNQVGYLLHCSYTWNKLTWNNKWTFTKSTWTWPTTLYVDRIRYWYKLLQQITNTNKTRQSFECPSQWSETQYAIELVTSYERNTPKLYDFNLYYDEVTDD